MLKVLPPNVYNLIAAGEVVKRPASVVKELLENSSDAGATAVTLTVNDFGRTLIQVTDNGCGMTREEAQLCFLSHATSKIESADDLEKLSTFGFRGEALASIAACADVTLKTRKTGEETGTELHIAASVTDRIEETACPVGCNIAVRNIFYNIPARRKFLKSDASEYRQIIAEFTRVALTRLDTEFRLINNSKEVFTLPAGRTLKQRIADVGGISAARQLIDIRVDTTVVKIYGFISDPGSAKKTQTNQFLFANGRFFRSAGLNKAVVKGYTGLIPEGYSPAYFIYMEVSPDEMDVNISPDKTEIKFENDTVIFRILEAAVREAIGKNAFAPVIEFDTEGVPPEIATADGFTMSEREKSEFRNGYVRAPQIDYDPLFNPFEEELKSRRNPNAGTDAGTGAITGMRTYESSMNADDLEDEGSSAGTYGSRGGNRSQNLQDATLYGSLGEREDSPLYTGRTVRGGRHDRSIPWQGGDGTPETLNMAVTKENIFLPAEDGGVTVIDIERARKRIFYERYLSALLSGGSAIQEELFPTTVDLNHQDFSTLMANTEALREIGFEIRQFGSDCIVVSGTPANFNGGKFSVEECLTELAHILGEEDNTRDIKDLDKERKRILALNVTGHTDFTAKTAVTSEEAARLVGELFACDDPAVCPTGGYTLTTITAKEIKERFL